MKIFSRLRRNIIEEGSIYNVKELFGVLVGENEVQQTLLDNPKFYDIETKTLKLGNLCARDIKSNKTPTITIGSDLYTTYCALAHLSNSLEPSLITTLHYNIDKIYNFLRRDLMLDNRRKFHGLLKTILSYDDPANTMNIIVKFIEETDSVDEVEVALDRFRKSEDVKMSDIEEFLKFIKSTGHQEYEKSFYGDHFKKYTTRLMLKYKTEEENASILKRVDDVIDGKYDVDKAVSILYKNIDENYTPKEMVKADLVCVKNVYNENNEIIIKNGDYLEVKKIDYAADSYLSEFMSMYKSTSLPDYAKEPNYINVYNQIIDGLYQKFDSRNDIIEDIKKNFAGIIYDDKIFINKDDIELYWSNKGRNPCLKDHRLSIRYRLKNKNTLGYVYEGGDVLKEKPVSVSLSSEKIICPITKSRLKESYSLNKISDLLLEGRKEDILKKYGGMDDMAEDTIHYFSNNDPSGNNKYLEWMTKTWLGLIDKDYSPEDNEVVDVVKLFHKNIQRIERKDINSYTFKELKETVKEAEEKRELAQLKKEAKKQKTIIYEDDKWFVVSPHSWKASCYYGAGTKWCVTAKNTSTHWDRYSRRASFFYVIDKTKNKNTDPLYKVAYRKIGYGDRYELWDAEDLEVSRRESGRVWFDSLPKVMKEKINVYHEEKHPKRVKAEWIDSDPKAQALLNQMGDVGIEYVDNSHYGLSVYDTDEGYYVVGNSSEMDDALWNYYDGYDDYELTEYYDYEGYYIQMYDEEQFIDEHVDSYIDNMSDDEMLEMTGKDGRYEDINNEVETLRDEREKIYVETDEEEEMVNDIEFQIEELITEQSNLIDEAKEEIEGRERESWEDCLYYGVVECLVNDRGWYRNASEIITSGIAELDRDGLIDSLVSNDGYDNLTSGYGYEEEQDDDGDWWIIFEIDY
jgi:uncharacterized protein (DUF1697 family)